MPSYYSKQLMSDISLVQTLTRLCLRSYANSCAMGFTFVCNAADTSQASRRENRFSCVSLSSPSPSARGRLPLLLSIAIIGRKEGRKREGKMTTELKETNGVSFFSPWQLSPRVIAAGLSSSSLSLSVQSQNRPGKPLGNSSTEFA